MLLPEGVFYRPRQEFLIAQDKWATIWMRTDGKYSANADYTIRDRTFERDIAPFLHGDWADFHHRLTLQPREIIKEQQEQYSTAVYSGAEHRGNPKLPNITVIPNLTTKESQGLLSRWEVFGCSMGHYHPKGQSDFRVQEVYEFQSYGLMVLDDGKANIEMWVAKNGDKVTVPNGCHMTLYNLGDRDNPLITLDYANPEQNPANKKLVSNCGPILLTYYNDLQVAFVLNKHYVNNEEYPCGVRLSKGVPDEQRFIKIVRSARLELGKLLYEELSHNYKLIGKFAQLGISVRQASPQAVLEPLEAGRGSRLYFCSPLVKATKQGTEIERYFFKDRFKPRRTFFKTSLDLHSASTTEEKAAADTADVAENQPRTSRTKRSKTLNRPLVIVVEGGGEWAEKAYRNLFIKKVKDEKRRLSVFYADDTRWKSRPAWAYQHSGLHDWETYLDKGDINDYSKYRILRPDVVFVVSPDFTHCDIARWWLGKVPVVFVEKPFDSQVKNVDDLLMENPQEHGTVIYGLDHYQFYALPIHDPDVDINNHLGKNLANVVFYLTENQALQKGRVHSLQYGLTLDLLPHLIALLTYFGNVSSIDEIRVIEAGQYFASTDTTSQAHAEELPPEFHNETYSRVEFTFLDHSGSGQRVPCTAVVGKGFPQSVKFLEVVGQNGNAIRIDLNEAPEKKNQNGEEARNVENEYPWNSLFFLLAENASLPDGMAVQRVRCPYNPQRELRVLSSKTNAARFQRQLERTRYGRLVDDLVTSDKQTVKSLLSMSDGRDIVFALDRIWWAVQAARPWIQYRLYGANPIQGTLGSALTPELFPDRFKSLDKDLVRPIRSYGVDARYGRSRIKQVTEPLPTRRVISRRRAKKSPHSNTLVELLEKLRKEVNGLPLTILIHNWGSEAAGRFLDTIHPQLQEELDAVWLIPIDKTKVTTRLPEIENVVMLNLSEDTDKRIYNNLVGDIVFYPAVDKAEAAHDRQFMRLARAVILDWGGQAVDTVLRAALSTGALTYLWSGVTALKEPETASASGVAGSEEELGSLAVVEVGRRLKDSATDLAELFYRRRLFTAELDRIFHFGSKETDWSVDLVRQADLHGWPPWAVECLPIFVPLEPNEAEGTQRAFVWSYIIECVPATYPFETDSELCDRLFSELTMPQRSAGFIAAMAQEFTRCFKESPINNDRDFLGTIVHVMTQIESIYPDAASKIREARMKVLAKLTAL